MEKVFHTYQPNIVFHAAAYKHVPILEQHPDEAVQNNILGTLNIGRAAIRNKTEKFVMISTDKAINPTSIMGASKRICEMLMVYLNKQNSTRFCAVRFGNVLGSRGSVIPIFQEQIKKNGPVEVTHPEMKRYFMITSEACLLVMQAGTIGEGGEVFVLDMGEPIKICDLAKELIKLAGYEPDVDVPIIYTGVRPGEKLFEEILTESEQPTKHEKIFISKLADVDDEVLVQSLAQFQEILRSGEITSLKQIIKQLVPTIN
jgi:FlaA1/EpsC-like NDP-sugar epimerase